MSAPVNYTNDMSVIASIDNFISINNAVDIDLFGQVNAESAGTKHISGAGGQLDFVLGAYLSNGGKSFICMSSTFKTKDGTVQSRIKPTLTNGSVLRREHVQTLTILSLSTVSSISKVYLHGRKLKLSSQLHILISGISLLQKQIKCIFGDRVIRDSL